MLFFLEIILTIILIIFLKTFLSSEKVYKKTFYFAGILLIVGGLYGALGNISLMCIQWFFYTPLVIFSLLLLILKMREHIKIHKFDQGNFKLENLNIVDISKAGKKIPSTWKDHGMFSLITKGFIVFFFIFINFQILSRFFFGKHIILNESFVLFLAAIGLFSVGLFCFITHKNLLINALSSILMYNGASLNYLIQENLAASTRGISSKEGTFVFLIIIVAMIMTLINFSFLLDYFKLKKNLFIDDLNDFKN
ncbi:MAG: hypothetical protein HQK51_02950 [Oligoflexia bacterium]|nr:hypothetical protein [Oligoflexia bacterium]